MKLSEFLVQVFGSERSNNEFEQLGTWKEEGELNAKHLKEMSLLNSVSSDLKDYQSFDVEAALNKTIPQLNTSINKTNAYTSTNSKKYIFILIGLLFLSLASILTYNYFGQTEMTYIASNSVEENQLDDGTVFLLNEKASLTFDERKNQMNLNGEAYFDVTKQEKPLYIGTSMGDIKVLGTSFNVISKDDYTEIYMYSGTISFTNKSDETITISENEGLKVSNGGMQKFESLNKQVFSYWLNRELFYKNAPLTNVLDDLERLFNKDYAELKSQAQDLTVTASFKDNSLDEITQELQVITGIKF